ncbi:MAG: glycosyltransferase family 39 protein [Planctomycetota bacterium]|jgi:4-amino-4-deoxy-L-arabinose transferase-like glycosyltransferase
MADENVTAGTSVPAGTPRSNEVRRAGRLDLVDKSTRTPFPVMAIIGLIGILAIALAFRLNGLDREGFWGDEYLQVNAYSLPLHYTIWNAMTRHGFGPPDFVVGWLAHKISPTVWMCRLPSALWGTVSILFMFLLARRLFSWQVGLMSALLLAFCRMHLVLSQEVRPYSMCVAFILLTLWMLMRCLENPTRVRLVSYGIIALICTMTRSFIPCVLLATIGLVLTVAYFVMHRKVKSEAVESGAPVEAEKARAVYLTWVATLITGGLAMAWVIFMLAMGPKLPQGIGTMLNSQAALASESHNPYQVGTAFVEQLTRNAGIMLNVIWQNFGPIVTGLMISGILTSSLRWGRYAVDHWCVMATMLFAGPMVIIIYSAISGTHFFYDRYSFFVMPFVAIFAAFFMGEVLRFLDKSTLRWGSWRQVAIIGIVGLIMVYPARMSAEELRSYRRIDWRSCAGALSERVGADDVVMVLTDAPFGRVQQRFFAKYEWPQGRRPLGEAVWTLAISDAHFQRLINQPGRCYATVARHVAPQRSNDYRRESLEVVPDNIKVTHFRGVDLIELTDRNLSGAQQIIQLCDALASLPLEHESARAIPLALKARVLNRPGLELKARAAHTAARDLVPAERLPLFDQMTAPAMVSDLDMFMPLSPTQ